MSRKKQPGHNFVLLHGPYKAPGLQVGQRATCLVRDRDCKVTSWTDARISWPKGVPVGGTGQPSIIVTEELARAVRCESAVAVKYHWGVVDKVVTKWRSALGVTRTNCEGTRRLRKVVSEKIGDLLRGVPLSEEHRRKVGKAAIRNNSARFFKNRWTNGWTPEEVALLGTDDDEVVAKKLGMSRSAVRSKWCRSERKFFRYRRGAEGLVVFP